MGEDRLGQRQAHGHEEGGPVDGVETEDVLTDDLKVRGPGVLSAREVVQQRIEPDIDHMLLIAWDGNAPLDARAADAEILQSTFHEALHLVEAEVGLYEVGMGRVEVQERLLILRKAEEVGLFFELDELVGEALGLEFLGLSLRDEGLVAHAVEALVSGLVDVAGIQQLLEPALHGLAVIRIRGADETVVGHAHARPQVRVVGDDLVRERFRRDAAGDCGLLHLLTVFVRAREEAHRLAHLAMEARERVRQHRRVDMPDVGPVVHIVDRRGDVEGLGHSWLRAL